MNEPVRPEDMRVSDADRTFVQDRLRRAHEIGQLDLYDFDERVARPGRPHRGELAGVVADPPAPAPARRRPRRVA